jgi:Flp pilus assembly protein TadG
MGRLQPRSRDEAGAVAVEFALVLPVLLLILFGVLEFGRVWSQVQVFQGAAREGARCAAVRAGELAAGLTPCNIRDRVVQAAAPYTPAFLPGAPTVTINGSPAPAGCTNTTRGSDVKVSWVQPLQVSIPFWKDVTWNMTISGVFRCE